MLNYACDFNIEPQRPNIIYILADDLGYGEIGVFGQKLIETPNIDNLAKSGMIFTDHYSGAPVCAPARSVLLTGNHSGNTHIRANGEWSERGNVWSFKAMLEDPYLEGQRPLLDSITTVAQVLHDNGYKTGMVGKWGLGAPLTNSIPNKKGFDFFYGYNCQRQAHTYYPTHLWKNETRDLLDNYIVTKQEGLDGLDPNEPESYSKYNQNDYAPTLMHKEALNFISRNQSTSFFLYYASPIPHLPLQAPKKWVNYYQKKFGKEIPYTGKSYYPNKTPRATYAAMISYLDEQVGELIEKLKEINQYENTLIIFTSDNGPSWVDHVDYKFFNSTGKFVNSRGTMKGSVSEGGIRVPMIASWPNKIKAGSKSNHISAFYDFFETACDVAGIDNEILTDGVSFYPEMIGGVQAKHDYLYWEYPASGGLQAIRMGKWKGVKNNLFKNPSKLKLFDLSYDEKELNDVSSKNPEIVKELEQKLKEAHSTPYLKEFIIPSLEQ
ncbi:arylsulfatase [Flavobacteriaceae bacterium]|nr:arylsulfatase [Flavobacteriaceae bacterium]MDB4005797.1 arylsulfatase [Flavobacteriaceae bacterium]